MIPLSELLFKNKNIVIKIINIKIFTVLEDFNFSIILRDLFFAWLYTARGRPRVQTKPPDLGHEPIPRPI